MVGQAIIDRKRIKVGLDGLHLVRPASVDVRSAGDSDGIEDVGRWMEAISDSSEAHFSNRHDP